MAASNSDYERGSMEIGEQKRTFDGFMSVTVWASAMIAAVLLALTLIFGAHVPWPASIGAGAALGVASGLALRLGGGWFATVIGLSILGGFVGLVYEIVTRFLTA